MGFAKSASSAFDGYGASKKSQIPDLNFIRGGVYRYRTVPVPVIEGFESASSQGTYFNSAIRGVYRVAKGGDPLTAQSPPFSNQLILHCTHG
ncbi:KTSC domain-containing protein [Marinobacter hydrocarbonoclasticus]|nr:KTSC domain-containing protein [Marinobacter nauticus]